MKKYLVAALYAFGGINLVLLWLDVMSGCKVLPGVGKVEEQFPIGGFGALVFGVVSIFLACGIEDDWKNF